MNIPICYYGRGGKKYKLCEQEIITDKMSNLVKIRLVYKVPKFARRSIVVSDFYSLKNEVWIQDGEQLRFEYEGWADRECKKISVSCFFVAGAEIRYLEAQESGDTQCF